MILYTAKWSRSTGWSKLIKAWRLAVSANHDLMIGLCCWLVDWTDWSELVLVFANSHYNSTQSLVKKELFVNFKAFIATVNVFPLCGNRLWLKRHSSAVQGKMDGTYAESTSQANIHAGLDDSTAGELVYLKCSCCDKLVEHRCSSNQAKVGGILLLILWRFHSEQYSLFVNDRSD